MAPSGTITTAKLIREMGKVTKLAAEIGAKGGVKTFPEALEVVNANPHLVAPALVLVSLITPTLGGRWLCRAAIGVTALKTALSSLGKSDAGSWWEAMDAADWDMLELNFSVSVHAHPKSSVRRLLVRFKCCRCQGRGVSVQFKSDGVEAAAGGGKAKKTKVKTGTKIVVKPKIAKAKKRVIESETMDVMDPLPLPETPGPVEASAPGTPPAAPKRKRARCEECECTRAKLQCLMSMVQGMM